MEAPKTNRTISHTSKFIQQVSGLFVGIFLFLIVTATGVLLLFLMASSTSSSANLWGIPNTGQRTSTLTISPTTTSTIAVINNVTPTPFLPKSNTPTPTLTPTITSTLTPTITNSPTSTNTFTPQPTKTPLPASDTPTEYIPPSASITNIQGYPQSLPLSCESRSAVDFAGFFGISIAEMDFQYALPVTDNPNTGFVGDPRHERGYIPPNSYGVHAAPVAALLRAYGLNAYEYDDLSIDDIRREISAGQPVIAWVVGNVWYGTGINYTDSSGNTMVVVPYEHTVIVTGYTEETITVLDGNLRYSTTIERFINSWSVLGNMAIIME